MNTAILNNLITGQLPTKEQTVQVVALADHEDENAYELVSVPTTTGQAFYTALNMLNDNADHVCILSTEDYTAHEHTHFGLAPYSINISKGIFA
jgi:hypothetical protein